MPSIIAPAKRVNLIPAGILAGLIGGVLVGLCLVAGGAKPAPLFQWVASNVVGRAAFASTSYVALGAAIHFAVAIAWGVIYAAVAQSGRPALVNRPVFSGLVYGFVVLVVMDAVEVVTRTYVSPNHDWALFAWSAAADMVFFGVPVALVVALAARRAVSR